MQTVKQLKTRLDISNKDLSRLLGIHPVNISQLVGPGAFKQETKQQVAFLRVIDAIIKHDELHPECAILPGLISKNQESG